MIARTHRPAAFCKLAASGWEVFPPRGDANALSAVEAPGQDLQGMTRDWAVCLAQKEQIAIAADANTCFQDSWGGVTKQDEWAQGVSQHVCLEALLRASLYPCVHC